MGIVCAGSTVAKCEDADDQPAAQPLEWPIYTQAQISEHKTKETKIWVTYKDGS